MVSGYIVDVVTGNITKGKLRIENGKIAEIIPDDNVDEHYIIPGFVDAHIHIESSMMVPSEFARYSLPCGTVACVCDPHEIANVCGIDGIDYMIENAAHSPMKFFFGAPSCVPSTHFEASGAVLGPNEVRALLGRDDIYFLAEMMNFPGVIHRNKEVHAKLSAAHAAGKPVDGHAPELKGDALKAYASAGISTDHECMTIAEAVAKIDLGMTVQIREGSAAKNFDDLVALFRSYPEKIMLCSDDKHPDDLLKNGHVNTLARRAVALGYNVMDVLRACCLTPVRHYQLPVGLVQSGDDADFLIVSDLKDFDVLATYVKGEKVAEGGKVCFERYPIPRLINRFNTLPLQVADLKVVPSGEKLRVIKVDDGQLFTTGLLCEPVIVDGNVVSDIENDVLKMVVYNRYQPSAPAIGFIRNIGLKRGALASSVAHDSHNLIAVGTSDAEIVAAINQLIESKGGIVARDGDSSVVLPLPVAGLMSDQDGVTVAALYEQVDAMAKSLGSSLHAPFMTMAFMSLLVIPELKLGDKGLFDGRTFGFVDLMI